MVKNTSASAAIAGVPTYRRPMRWILLGALLALSLSGTMNAPTTAAPSSCQVGSQVIQYESRSVDGKPAGRTHYGRIRKVVKHRPHRHVIFVRTVVRHTYTGHQTRSVTTTTTQCQPTETATVTSTPWRGAGIVTTRRTQVVGRC